MGAKSAVMAISSVTQAGLGLQTAADQFARSAADVIQATAPSNPAGTGPGGPTTASDARARIDAVRPQDPTNAVIGTVQARAAFSANASVLRTADQISGTLVDLLA
ncbi:MAG: hypothetical protein ACFB2Z_14500 [Maricaulaceae bacterium]